MSLSKALFGKKCTTSIIFAALLMVLATPPVAADEQIQAYVGQQVILHIQGKPSNEHVWRLNETASSDPNRVKVMKLGWSVDKNAWYGTGTLRFVATPLTPGNSQVVISLGRKHVSDSVIKTKTFNIRAIAADTSISTSSTKPQKLKKMPWQE